MNEEPNLLDDVLALKKKVESLLERLEQVRGDHADELKTSQCGRALSIAYTNIEQAGLWLGKTATIRDQEMLAEYERRA